MGTWATKNSRPLAAPAPGVPARCRPPNLAARMSAAARRTEQALSTGVEAHLLGQLLGI